MSTLSPLAIQKPRRSTSITRRKPFGLLVHTTGRGIPARATATGRSTADVALAWYRQSQDGANGYPWGGPTYVLDHDGSLYQIADDDIQTNHCGGPHRQAYLDGSWTLDASPEIVKRWRAAWPEYKSPQHLYPSRSPNADYIGAEMIPCGSGLGTPMRKGLLFTRAQHDKVIELARDLAERHGWPDGWARTPRLLGHEDVQPLERDDSGGGWDPGYLRAKPYFDFDYVRSALDPDHVP